MERAIQVKLRPFLDENKALSVFQSGFRKKQNKKQQQQQQQKHSTEIAIIYLVDHILEHLPAFIGLSLRSSLPAS